MDSESSVFTPGRRGAANTHLLHNDPVVTELSWEAHNWSCRAVLAWERFKTALPIPLNCTLNISKLCRVERRNHGQQGKQTWRNARCGLSGRSLRQEGGTMDSGLCFSKLLDIVSIQELFAKWLRWSKLFFIKLDISWRKRCIAVRCYGCSARCYLMTKYLLQDSLGADI